MADNGMKKWEADQRKSAERSRLIRAIGKLMLEQPYYLRDVSWALDQVANALPGLALHEEIKRLEEKEAKTKRGSERAAAKSNADRRRRAKKAKTERKPRAAKKATPATPKAKPAVAPRPSKGDVAGEELETRALDLVDDKGQVTVGELMASTGAERGPCSSALKRLAKRGRLTMQGRNRAAKYILAPATAPAAAKQPGLFEDDDEDDGE